MSASTDPHQQLDRILAFVATLLMASSAVEANAESKSGVDRLKTAISIRYPGTEWVAREALSQWLQGDTDSPVVLLDSRSEEEFAISHLSGALRVDPEVEAKSLSHLEPNARVVVYCSVGYRSAAVARRLTRAGFETVYNLEGGIFGWANDGRAVYQGQERAAKVHPYNSTWGRLLDERFHPEN